MDPIGQYSKRQLYRMARNVNLPGRSKLTKRQLYDKLKFYAADIPKELYTTLKIPLACITQKLIKLKRDYNWKDIGWLGRFEKMSRRLFLLHDKQNAQCRYALKILTLKTQIDRANYAENIRVLRQVTRQFPTRLVASWRAGPCGFILTTCLNGAISWLDSRLSKTAARKAFHAVVAQLKHLHRHRWYHGDLAPKNIVVNSKGEAGLIDFEDAVAYDRHGKPRLAKIHGRYIKRYYEVPRSFKQAVAADWAALLSSFLPYYPDEEELAHIPKSDLKLIAADNVHYRRLFPILWQVYREHGLTLDALGKHASRLSKAVTQYT